MEKQKFYIASRDGLNSSAIFIDESGFTLPEDERVARDEDFAGPITVTLSCKIDDKSAKRIKKLMKKFDNEREEKIKECAKHFGFTEDEIRQILEKYEKEMGVRMIPSIKNPN